VCDSQTSLFATMSECPASKSTISSTEFQQKLQAGQIHEALTLLTRDATLLQRGFTNELDITTHITTDSNSDTRSPKCEYLRTKINLLTGEIHNEVGRDLVLSGTSYIKLQQLHIDQIIASHRIVQGHLHQIKAISIALLQKTPQQPPLDLAAIKLGEIDSDSLATRLTRSMSIQTEHLPDLAATMQPLADREILADSNELKSFHNSTPASMSSTPEPVTIVNEHPYQIDPNPDIFDDEIDLSVNEDEEIWEEWVEDDRFLPESLISQPTSPTLVELQLPDWQPYRVGPPSEPIEIKPIVTRARTVAIDPSEQWEKFAPEHIGISDTPQPRFSRSRELDRLLSDLNL
jgi:hypothetical protein